MAWGKSTNFATLIGVPTLKRVPLAVRLPIVVAILFLAGMMGTSHVVLISMLVELERQVQRVGSVYIDAIATMVSPHMVTADRQALNEALDRSIRLARSIQKHQLLAYDTQKTLLAHTIREENSDTVVPTPEQQLFLLRDDRDSAWVGSAVWIDEFHVGYLLAEIDVGDIRARHRALRWMVMVIDLALGIVMALLGFVLMRRMLGPVAVLTERLQHLAMGDARPVPAEDLPPVSTEFGQLLRRFNRMVFVVREREKLAGELADQDRAAALGQLAATVAHEVRNPLAGMSNAVATIRRFGDKPEVREQSLNLLDRGLESIGNVVQATLTSYRGGSGVRALGEEDLEDLRLLVAPEARRRKVRLDWNVRFTGSAPVRASELRQILLNLLLNACAITPADGTVRFGAERRGTELVFTVEDQGIGMPPAVARTLEDQEEDAELPRGGLGARVVIRLVRELSGQVSAASSPQTGTRITLVIPFLTEP